MAPQVHSNMSNSPALQVLGNVLNSSRSFAVERQARQGSIASKSQNLNTEMLRMRSPRKQAKYDPPAKWTRRPVASWLAEALTHLERIDQEAEEEGYPPSSDLAKKNAKQVLLMASGRSLEPAVYPSMDGEVALYFKSPDAPAALLILLDSEGGAGCYWSLNGKSERRRYDDASKLPADFVRAQLRTLGGSPLSQSIE